MEGKTLEKNKKNQRTISLAMISLTKRGRKVEGRGGKGWIGDMQKLYHRAVAESRIENWGRGRGSQLVRLIAFRINYLRLMELKN